MRLAKLPFGLTYDARAEREIRAAKISTVESFALRDVVKSLIVACCLVAWFATPTLHSLHVVNVCEISCGFCTESIYFYNLNLNFDFEGLLMLI